MYSLYCRENNLYCAPTVTFKNQQDQPCYFLMQNLTNNLKSYQVYSICNQECARLMQIKPDKQIYALYQQAKLVGICHYHQKFGKNHLWVKHLNWLIINNPRKKTYRIYHFKELIATIKPVTRDNGTYLECNIGKQTDEPLVLGLLTILHSCPVDPILQHNLQTDLTLS
ncbi:hypothetical protein [Ligilactobacillus ceti]|uniref:Uncharacterized protein n=1 Tax=Ligilactobacillus ceti DSM 22408 TaxID=1122146 RepID=A0A0R2KKV5_9LACO|nr:hypothetical protein [Ligilactobacillus ceti]KRN90003.1 hypothetical protein IV53_GL001121 [Ligilactobacillus ceti DSM 22408]